MLTYVKSYRTYAGDIRTSTVTVEPCDGKVLVVSRDGNRAPSLARRTSADPGRLAAELAEDLITDGYTAA